jgi:hypothetical protein
MGAEVHGRPSDDSPATASSGGEGLIFFYQHLQKNVQPRTAEHKMDTDELR